MQKPLDHYRIDVESDSTVRADLEKGRQERAEFLGGTGQYFAAMAPLVQSAPGMAEPIAEIYGSFARQFNLGKQAEDALERLVAMAKEAATNPPPNPEAEAMKAEMQAKQESEARKYDLELKKLGFDARKSQLDVQLKERELGLKEKVAEVDAAARLVEIEMEDDQQRAVAFGDQ